ncbi:MAG: TonB-dependent receptor [Bacteroidales bacterium]|nr:TonB-dependent receptor [Bacteroidales bacterium]
MKKIEIEGLLYEPSIIKKYLLAMKLTIIITFAFITSMSALESYSQKTTISLDLQNVTLRKVIKEIKKTSEFSFWYSNDEFNDKERVSISVKDKNITAILNQLLRGKNLKYTIKDRHIVIYKPKQEELQTNKTDEPKLRSINGIVTDAETNEPLIGVNIVERGTNNGVITNLDGKFSIQIPDSSVTLIFSYIGYLKQTILVTDQKYLEIKLKADVTGLDEVVVIGFGTVKKKDLTGSIVAINTEDLGTPPVSNVGEAIQGRAAGVHVITQGEPGNNVSFRIRGTGTINDNEPLIVVDGLPLNGGLNQVNINDIETVQILKDASATAIYGSRGANGVVILTTKRGKEGASKLNIDYFYGWQQATNMIEMLNASEFAQMHNEMLTAGGQITNPEFANPVSLGEGTNWLDELFRVAPMQNYSLSYSTGGEKSNIYVSGSYLDQQGIVINNDYKRYLLQFNSDSKITNWLKFGNSLKLEHSIKTRGAHDIRNTMLALPAQPVYRADGNYSGPIQQPIYDGDIENPIGKANTVDISTKGYNVHGSIYAEMEFIPGLKLKSNAGLEANIWNDRTWAPKYNWDSQSQENSYLYQKSSNAITWMWDNTLTYDKTIADVHRINVMAGISAQSNRFEFMDGSKQQFASDKTQQLGNGTLQPTINGNASEWTILSFIGRANYVYDDRYYITATIRRDGSSRFGSENKWGTFPSASVAWRISNESFMENISFVDDLKLRFGYGLTGNQSIGNYSYASALNTVRYNFGDSYVSAVVPNKMPNPYVQWESQEQFNVGLDLWILNNRINLSADAYLKNTNDMLVPMAVPISTGYSDIDVPYINAGKIQNKGIEFTVASKNLTGELAWSTDFTASFNKNEVISINDSVPMTVGSIGLNYNLALIEAGHPMNVFYGFVTNGLFQTDEEVANSSVQVPGNDPYSRTSAGDIKFRDLNNDGVINDDDRTYLGNPNPDIIFSMNNTFTYKGFDLNIYLQGVYGNKIFNANRLYTEAMAVSHNQTKETLYRWTGEGTSNDMPRAVYNDPNKNNRASNRFIEDGSYLRIKNITFGYTFSKEILGRIKLSSARVYASAQNLYTFTKYKGIDPEVSVNGIDNNIYPVTRTFSLGVNIGF